MRRILLVMALGIIGCAPATRYPLPTAAKEEPPAAAERPARPRAPAADLGWMPPDPDQIDKNAIAIEFVHESNSAEWNRLKAFWTLEPTAVLPPLSPLSPLGQGVAAATTRPAVVKIKIPAGLDPIGREQIPEANPPTVAKWQLGKQLFFDDGWLQSEDDAPLSCSSCHRPVFGFTDHRLTPPGWKFNTPTLVNVVYNKHFFWDGRAAALEEVVQRTLEDERESAGDEEAARRHVWGGVIHRLRRSDEYSRRFQQVFGTPPTQDALGKALATYLRTVLSGDSLHDRAERVRRERQGKELEPADYEKVLDATAIDAVLLEKTDKEPKEKVAQQLHAGWKLFHGKAKCSACHSGGNFTDNGFHNLGVELLMQDHYNPGEEPGRFAALPIGRKDWAMIGAYKTPPLRALLGTAPYFHDGFRHDLFDVVQVHVKGSQIRNRYLDPLLRDAEDRHRDFGLNEEEARALTMFLKALDGAPIDPVVADPTRWPEGTAAPKQK
jgi:cytochrome c peroxidase